MYDQVGVATDGGGEMCIVGLAQTVVPVRAGTVLRLFETAQDMHFQSVALWMFFKFFEQHPHLARFAEVAALHSESKHGLTQLLQLFILRLVVDTVDGGKVGAFGGACDLLVGTEHELFDQLVAFVVDFFFDTIGVALLIDVDFDRSHVEVE